MRSVTLQERKSLVSALSAIMYSSKRIPAYEERVQETANNQIALVTIGNQEIQCYMIIKNQTQNDNSPKCVRNDETSIQIQTTTVWPLNKGGSQVAEEINEQVFDALFPAGGIQPQLVLPEPFKMWSCRLLSAINISYATQTNSVWINQLVITSSISQD